MSGGGSHNQTLSFLGRRFREAGIRPHAQLGQNFLVDLNLLRLLVRAAEIQPNDVVLEVGTGTGSLTAQLAEQAAAVVTVEVDRQLHQLACEELAGQDNVTMLLGDALAGKNRLNPDVVAAVRAQLDAGPDRRFKLVANLPYHVATPLISNLLALDRPPDRMAVTIQKELADRLVAVPGTRDYGSLSLWVQAQCRVELVRVLPPSVFWPRPKVSSAIVRIDLDPQLRQGIADLAYYHGFVRAIFLHRRKLLRFELGQVLKDAGKPEVDRIMAEQGLDASVRAEELDVPTMLRLAEAVRRGGRAASQCELPLES